MVIWILLWYHMVHAKLLLWDFAYNVMMPYKLSSLKLIGVFKLQSEQKTTRSSILIGKGLDPLIKKLPICFWISSKIRNMRSKINRYFPLINNEKLFHFRVVSVISKEKIKSRPVALNTVELMRVASSGLGMGPQHAMQIAEKLYTQGYISYPRTETTKYPENFDLM